MADIEVRQQDSLVKGHPGMVHLLLKNDEGEVVGHVSACQRWDEQGKFQVEIHKGSTISPDIDIRVQV